MVPEDCWEDKAEEGDKGKEREISGYSFFPHFQNTISRILYVYFKLLNE